MKVLSLFDGISCGMLALQRANINVDEYVAYEIDESSIKISKNNFPNIIHKGNVYDAKYYEGEYDLLIGGSPCTYWSIARCKDRETTSSGLGFDLFMQYYRALKEVKPRYFLYENNYSMSTNIRNEITKYLGVEPIMIDSAKVSGQSRRRLYWTNIPGVTQPIDKNIIFKDVLTTINWKPVSNWVYTYWGTKQKIEMLKTINALKSPTLTTSATHSLEYIANEERTHYFIIDRHDREALQTIPRGYCDCVSTTVANKAIGNGWTIDVIAHILSFIKD